MDEYYRLLQSLPPALRAPLEKLDIHYAPYVQEIRLRLGQPVLFTMQGRLCPAAKFLPGARLPTVLDAEALRDCFLQLCRRSVYAYEDELKQGYFTVQGGCRIGVAGCCGPGGFSAVTSLNLRIARWLTCPLPPELEALTVAPTGGLLLAGPPGSGKTTLLRSIARELVRQQKILSVIDERRELFAGNTHGEALDVLAGLPKGQAVQMALRTLSPQVILLDELGGLDEVTALEQGLFSGVDFIATLHAATPEEATMRPQVKYLMERGAVRVLVWLTGRQAPGCIGEVRFL